MMNKVVENESKARTRKFNLIGDTAHELAGWLEQ
jgi:hypothetical protein